MTKERFEHVLSEVRGKTKEVVLHLLGEPLSHPDLAALIESAARFGVPVNIVTNGTLLFGKKVEAVLHPIVRQVSISLQSAGDNFPDQDPAGFLRRIAAFVAAAEVNRPDLYINLRFWDLEGAGAADSPINQTLRERVSEVFGFSWTDVRLDVRRRKNFKIRGRLYLHFDTRFAWPDLSAPKIGEHGFCYALSGHIGIHSDGTVVPCCLDANAAMPLGNIFDETLDQTLQSKRALRMIDGFKRRILTEDLCKTCGYIKRFSRKRQRAETKTP